MGGNSLSLTIKAGAYTVVTDPAQMSSVQGAGTWTCGPDFPLAQDSTLAAYGLDPNAQLPGVWQMQQLQGIE
jgi:hypothetical protein